MRIEKRTSVSKEEVMSAITGSMGMIEPIERKLNCTRSAVKFILDKFPEVKQELDDELEREKDKIIIAMISDSQNGDDRLRCKARDSLMRAIAKDRGFGEQRLEVTGAEGKPLVFLHTAAKLQTVEGWAQKAALYADERERALDDKMKELGLSGNITEAEVVRTKK